MINLPEEYEKEMRSLLGAEFEEYKKIYEQPVRQGLRFNPYKLTKPVWEEIMPFEKEEIPWVENGYYIHGGEGNPARHPYYFAGLYYLQEPSAMTPASRLEIQPYDKVLDLCAAPGGKATELVGRLQGKGFLLANDLSNSRAKALLKNLELTGAPNFYVTSEEPAKLVKSFPEFFDKILIDAPCSGEGMFHKEPKMAEYWLEKSPDYYAEIQKELIVQGAQMLKPGGKMLQFYKLFPVQKLLLQQHLLQKLLPVLLLVQLLVLPSELLLEQQLVHHFQLFLQLLHRMQRHLL